jgi:hypothetical protein
MPQAVQIYGAFADMGQSSNATWKQTHQPAAHDSGFTLRSGADAAEEAARFGKPWTEEAAGHDSFHAEPILPTPRERDGSQPQPGSQRRFTPPSLAQLRKLNDSSRDRDANR